jgi:protein phosphatase
MRVSLYGTTDVGRRRSSNEDGFVIHDLTERATVDPPHAISRPIGKRGVLVAVCDGMGGHAAGEIASSLALESLEEEMERIRETCPRPDLLKEAVAAVNERVWQQSRLDPKLSGMGTTLTAALVCERRALFAHIGDSRAYFGRGGRVQQITKDQSVAASLIEAGELTEEEAKSSPYRHVLLQAVGTKRDVEIALDGAEVRAGDTVLLCSDGLSGKVERADLARHLAMPDLKEAGDALVSLANSRGGEDNITVVIARLEA